MSPFKKEILTHEKFYIAKFTRDSNTDYLIFIHGGPGYNCGVIEYLIEHDYLFNTLNYNIILYDQRGCGRSTACGENAVHRDNINDLNEIYEYFKVSLKMNIKGFIGHSYGAKLLFDFYKQFAIKIPGIFISTARSILTPRVNNLILDLAYLKKTNPAKYKKTLFEMDNLTTEKMWELTEKLSSLFRKNKDRDYLYWANMDIYKKIQRIQNILNLPVNSKTFMSVRKDLYSMEENYPVDIENLTIPYLWVNGFHDFIVNGKDSMLSKNKFIISFYKSSHYPHLEENDRFCEIANHFMLTEKIRKNK